MEGVIVGTIRQIHYSEKKYPGMPLQDRHCRVLLVAPGRPKNVLVKLKEGIRVVVPFGNLREPQPRLFQITSSYFCAGAVYHFGDPRGWWITAPILRMHFMRARGGVTEFRNYCLKKGWKWEEVKEG